MNTRIEYLIGDKITDIIENAIYNFYRGRVDFTGPELERRIDIHTGIAGQRQARECIMQMAVNSGLVINASEIGAITGKSTEPLAYTSYTIPFLANVRFHHNAEFDPMDTEKLLQYVDGYPINSYNYCITDNQSSEQIDVVAIGVREPRGPIKYYWVFIGDENRITQKQEVCTVHPFILYPDFLINWKEITKNEYELFKQEQLTGIHKLKL